MVESLIPLAESLEMKFIGIGMECMIDDEAVHTFANTLNRIGKVCAEHGLTLTLYIIIHRNLCHVVTSV